MTHWKDKNIRESTMKHVFEKDATNATINPLYIQKNTSVETTTTETNFSEFKYIGYI